MTFRYLVILFIFYSLLSCEDARQRDLSADKNQNKISNYSGFHLSGAESAQPHFLRGLQLLHSFEYEKARSEFIKAQEIDTSFAMAYWGEAMTYNQTLYLNEDRYKGLEALSKYTDGTSNTEELFKTELEYRLFVAAELIFDDGTKYERDLAYNAYMKKLYADYPDNQEVATLYALSILGKNHYYQEIQLKSNCAAILEKVLENNSNHIGALHYLLHTYELMDSLHLGESIAQRFLNNVPKSAGHGLHMPSHAYFAIGNWDEVVQSNISSWNVGRQASGNKSELLDYEKFHALSWVHYGLLQKEKFDDALDLLRKVESYTSEIPSKTARYHLMAMKGAQMVGSNIWDKDWTQLKTFNNDLRLTTQVGYHFLEGMKAYNRNDTTTMLSQINAINKKRTVAEDFLVDRIIPSCLPTSIANKPTDQLDLDLAMVKEMQLTAQLQVLKGHNEHATRWFKRAAILEEKLNPEIGPPLIFKPALEAYGEWLLQNDRPDEAVEIFTRSLKLHPQRIQSLRGLNTAAQILDNENLIAQSSTQLESILLNTQFAKVL